MTVDIQSMTDIDKLKELRNLYAEQEKLLQQESELDTSVKSEDNKIAEETLAVNDKGVPITDDLEFSEDYFKPRQDLYGLWGAEVTPEMQQQFPLASKIAKGAQDYAVTPMLHFLNQAGLNAPRAVAESFGQRYPESEGMGDFASKAAGVYGALKSAPAKMLQKGVVRPILKTGALTGKGLAKAVSRGAVGGAITGAAYTPRMGEAESPEEAFKNFAAPKERGMQALIGAAVGGLAGAGLFGIKRYKTNQKNYQKDVARLEKQKKFESKLPAEKIASQQKEVRRNLTIRKQQIQQENANAVQTVRSNKERVLQEIRDTAQGKASDWKPVVREFARATSETYGSRIDDISNSIGRDIKKSSVKDLGTSFMKRVAEETDLIDDPFVTQIKDFFKNFKGDKAISFKKLNGMIKGYRGGKASGKNAVIKDILTDEYMKFASQYTDDFATLQKEFAPILESKSMLTKFIGSGDEIIRPQAENFFIKVATNKPLTGKERQLYNAMEGIAGKQGIAMDDLTNSFIKSEKAIKQVQQAKQQAISEATKSANKRISTLESRALKVKQIKRQGKEVASRVKEQDKKSLGNKAKKLVSDKVADKIFKASMMYAFYKIVGAVKGE